MKHYVPGIKKEFEVLYTVSNLTALMNLNDVMEDYANKEVAVNANIANEAEEEEKNITKVN